MGFIENSISVQKAYTNILKLVILNASKIKKHYTKLINLNVLKSHLNPLTHFSFITNFESTIEHIFSSKTKNITDDKYLISD